MTRQSSFAPGGGPDCPDAIGRPVVDAHQLASDPDWAPLWSQDGVAPSQLLTGSRQAERHLLEPEYGTQRRPHPPDHRSRPAADAALLQKRQRLALRFLLFRYVVFYIIQQVAQTSAKVSNIQQGTSGDSIKRVEIFVGLLLSAAKCRATQIGFPNKWHFFFFLFLFLSTDDKQVVDASFTFRSSHSSSSFRTRYCGSAAADYSCSISIIFSASHLHLWNSFGCPVTVHVPNPPHTPNVFCNTLRVKTHRLQHQPFTFPHHPQPEPS